MKFLFLKKNTLLDKENKFVNLSTQGVFDKYFSEKKIKLLKTSKLKNILDNYNYTINDHLKFISKSLKNNEIYELISYMTFSKLVVSDDLINKFWVLSNIEFYKNHNVTILLDDKVVYNHYSSIKNYNSIFPSKIIYKFILYFFKLVFSLFHTKMKIKNDFNFFVGNVFVEDRVIDKNYYEYFFSKYWKKHSNSKLLLINNSPIKNCFYKSNQIFFKENLVKFKDLLKVLLMSIRHFYDPIQVNEKNIYDTFINYNLKKDSKSSSFLDAYINVPIFKNLSKKISNKKGQIIIPHEGRVYEKIIYKIFQDFKNVQVTGYCHFPLSEKIQNLNFSPLHKIVYNKYKIYTLGEINFNILTKNFNWPIEFIKIGAHLKKNPLSNTKIINVKDDYLVLLGMEFIPNIKLLNYIKTNIITHKKIIVRAHPSVINKYKIQSLCRKFNFEFSKNKKLSDDLSTSNVLFYGDTGAVVECLIDNISLNYISDDVFLDSDRLNNHNFIHNRLSVSKSYNDKFFQDSVKNYKFLNKIYISKTNPSDFEFK